jgi:hypothetical protein
MQTETAVRADASHVAPANRLTLGERFRMAPHRSYWPLVGLGMYLVIMKLTTGWRPEHFIGAAVMLFAFYWNALTRRIAIGLVPFLATALVYDLTHLTQPLVQYLHVHMSVGYLFDKTLLGIRTTGGLLTPNEFFARHHWPVVDFFTGGAYIVFLYLAIAFPAALSFPCHRPDLHRIARQFGWAFLTLNVGFITYYVFPAAPPWYVAAHGFGPPDFTVLASPAAAIRWDQLTGIHYFEGFYGRSADIFGAIPSLHVATPFLVFLYGTLMKKRWFNVVAFAFYVLVCFSAIYLQHHYVLDITAGTAYAALTFAGQRWVSARLLQRRTSRACEAEINPELAA